jgi:hypothetical protein
MSAEEQANTGSGFEASISNLRSLEATWGDNPTQKLYETFQSLISRPPVERLRNVSYEYFTGKTRPERASIATVADTVRERTVPGTINGEKVEAIPDTGADESFISAAFLDRLVRQRQQWGNKLPEHHPIAEMAFYSLPPVRLASGKTVTANSMAVVPWRFEGESKLRWLSCRVLPECAHDLILGDSFLRMTETLTKFKHRIKTTVRLLGSKLLSSLRLNYMGFDKRRLWGYLDGELVPALPDSGSDIMVISADYARRRGFFVDRGPDKQVMVQFADGSTTWTDGVVRGVEWEFGYTGGKVASDFFVLEDLPVDVVLSSDFVFDHDVFGAHERSFYEYGAGLDWLHLCNIRLIGRYSRDLEKLEEEGLVDRKLGSHFPRHP